MSNDGLQVAGLLIDPQLAFRAGTVLENGVNVFDGAAAAEIVHDVIHKFEELKSELAHGDFSLFAEINQLALNAVASGAPLVLFDQCTAVETIALIALVKPVEFYDDRLCESRDGDCLFDLGGYIKHAELESAKHGVWPDVPPDFFSVVDAV